jgi:polyhydroxyalkanoate synthase subunit PhaC
MMTTDVPSPEVLDDLAISADPLNENQSLAPNLVALQQKYGPRPLPLFLELVARECGGDAARVAAVMQGLRAFETAERLPPRALAPVVASIGRAKLHDFGGSGPPLIFVPSLINPPTVLDLMAGHSLLEWMAAQGFRVLLVDWGSPDVSERDLDIGGHATRYLVPLIESLGEAPLLAGYCLGGTMAIAAACLTPVRALALIAAPWNFSGFPDTARAEQASLWQTAQPSANALGLMPMEILQSGFWRLDPARTVGKYAEFAMMEAGSSKVRRFIAVEDWANDGPPLTYGAAREAFEDFFGGNVTGLGTWRVGGGIIDPAKITCPTLDIISTVDRIVPAASASGLPNRLVLGLGHVGMIVGSRAPKQLWQPLAGFMSNAG